MSANPDDLKRSFGSIAMLYDAARPSYPDAVAQDVLASFDPARSLRVLEIGCGTGQATRMLAARGHQILATDLSPELVAVAQQRLAAFPQVRFLIGAFEQLTLPDGAFDLIISAQAFHWIDPAVGVPKAARLLAPQGVLALFWNFLHYDATTTLQAVRDACVHHMPAFAGWPDASEARFDAFAEQWHSCLQAAPTLTNVAQAVYHTTYPSSRTHFQQLLTTFSWFQTQPEDVRAALLRALVALLPASEALALPVRTLLLTACVVAPDRGS